MVRRALLASAWPVTFSFPTALGCGGAICLGALWSCSFYLEVPLSSFRSQLNSPLQGGALSEGLIPPTSHNQPLSHTVPFKGCPQLLGLNPPGGLLP